MEGQLQHLRERARCSREPLDWQGSSAQSERHDLKELQHSERFRFDFKTFTELKNAQSVALVYDGLNPSATNLYVPEALLQRREQVVFPATWLMENSDERLRTHSSVSATHPEL